MCNVPLVVELVVVLVVFVGVLHGVVVVWFVIVDIQWIIVPTRGSVVVRWQVVVVVCAPMCVWFPHVVRVFLSIHIVVS